MGVYSENFHEDEDFGIDMGALVEAFVIDDLTHNYGEETIKEFCAPGGVGEALLEAKLGVSATLGLGSFVGQVGATPRDLGRL